jgi:DNA-binding NarL/FixJ family response regulator
LFTFSLFGRDPWKKGLAACSRVTPGRIATGKGTLEKYMNGEPPPAEIKAQATTASRLSDQTTRIIVCDPRRLLRQSLAAWLHAQPSIEVAATISSIAELRAAEENLSKLNADVLLITLSGAVGNPERDQQFLQDQKAVAARLPNLRIVAIVDEAHADTSLLRHGFHALVNAASGTAGILRSLLAGSSELMPHVTEHTFDDPGPLTARETEVLQLIGHGSTTETVASELGISVSTVASHKERIFAKLGANNQAHAVARAIELGLLRSIDIRGDISRMTISVAETPAFAGVLDGTGEDGADR